MTASAIFNNMMEEKQFPIIKKWGLKNQKNRLIRIR